MNRIQKSAWFTIVCTGAGLILSCIATVILYSLFGFPMAYAGTAFMALAGFSGMGLDIFKKDPGVVTCDERDLAINSTAAKISFAATFIVFGLLCMGIFIGVFLVKGLHGTLTVNICVLPMIWMFAGMTGYLIHALTILILYGRDKTSEGDIK